MVGFSGIQSPAESQVFSPDFSLSLSPVFLNSSRRRILRCPLYSVGEKKPFPRGGQGEGWEALEVIPAPSRPVSLSPSVASAAPPALPSWGSEPAGGSGAWLTRGLFLPARGLQRPSLCCRSYLSFFQLPRFS